MCLVAAGLLFALAIPFQKNSAWKFYEQMVTRYEMIQDVELSDLEGDLKEVVAARNDCYLSFYRLPPRLSICRKRYLTDILALARKEVKSAPELGKFMLCVRDCPLAYSMCRGTDINGTDAASECTKKELQCIELCLDLYWREIE